MSKRLTIPAGIFALGILAVSGIASAADEVPAPIPSGMTQKHHRADPVAHTQLRLDRLATKLNLTDDQKPAWQTYADSTLGRAKERTAKREAHHMQHGQPHADLDTASKLDRMAQSMRERADTLQKVAQDTRAFENVLSSEQKTIFDLYWKSEMHQRMHHRPAA